MGMKECKGRKNKEKTRKEKKKLTSSFSSISSIFFFASSNDKPARSASSSATFPFRAASCSDIFLTQSWPPTNLKTVSHFDKFFFSLLALFYF